VQIQCVVDGDFERSVRFLWVGHTGFS
jgi:hypothetical protein